MNKSKKLINLSMLVAGIFVSYNLYSLEQTGSTTSTSPSTNSNNNSKLNLNHAEDTNTKNTSEPYIIYMDIVNPETGQPEKTGFVYTESKVRAMYGSSESERTNYENTASGPISFKEEKAEEDTENTDNQKPKVSELSKIFQQLKK